MFADVISELQPVGADFMFTGDGSFLLCFDTVRVSHMTDVIKL